MSERSLSIAFVAATFVFLCLTFYLLATDSAARGGIAFLTAALCALFGNLHRIASFKATLTSIEAKMREVTEVVDEAKATLKSLHEVAAMAGARLIELNAAMGRWDGTSTAMKDATRDRIIQSLRSIALGKSELAEVAAADKEWVIIDYAQGIFAGWASHRKPTPDEQAIWDEFSKPWQGVGLRWPTPEECQACMDKLGIADVVARDLLEDYRHYVQYGEHRRPEVWRSRNNWLRRTQQPK
jgi:hypothetical protein